LAPGDALHAQRRFRPAVVAATQASHDALLHEPSPGLHTADRLRVAVAACEAAQAPALAAHYRALLADEPSAALPASPALAAMQRFAQALTTDPRQGDRAALAALQHAGLADAAIVALAQLVGFLSYQTRVVAGLKAMQAAQARPQPAAPAAGAPTTTAAGAAAAATTTAAGAAAAAPTPAPAHPGATAAAVPTIRGRGYTSETLDWASWLTPVALAQATPLQLEVLDESHPQSRSSAYYLTLAHQPLMLRHRSSAYNTIMYAPGGAPRAERELGAMVVSVTNGCVYCTSVHAQRYMQLAKRHDTVQQVFDNPATAGSTAREQAIARLAQAVTLRPQSLGADDIAPLQTLGLADEAVLDVLHATAIFGWANRLMHNLGEPVAAAVPSP
jgi:uncharacterized peroxidase-related enzyme